MANGAGKEAAIKLRISGRSYNEIGAQLGVPKSTLRSWLHKVVLSEKARARINSRIKAGSLHLVKRNKMQTHAARQRAKELLSSASSSVRTLNKDDLRIIGAVLYWAEGYKRPLIKEGREITAHSISFVNSDPDMIRVFIRFLTECLDVDPQSICLTMRLYPHINEEFARLYWKKVTRLSYENFRKSTLLITGASKGTRPFNRLPYGTLQISVYQTSRFYSLMGLLAGIKRQMI